MTAEQRALEAARTIIALQVEADALISDNGRTAK